MIRITPKAAEQIKKSAREGKMEGMPLRIAVMRKGDKGFHYAMGFDDSSRHDDFAFRDQGVNVVVSGETLRLIKDMEIDFVEIEEGKPNFIFLNPNDPTYIPPKESPESA